MSDNSLLDAANLASRPFTEELDDTWRIVRGICLSSLIVAFCLWFFSFMASAESFGRAKTILNLTGWFAFIIFVFSYVSLYWEIKIRDKENLQEKHRQITGFTNVEKKSD